VKRFKEAGFSDAAIAGTKVLFVAVIFSSSNWQQWQYQAGSC